MKEIKSPIFIEPQDIRAQDDAFKFVLFGQLQKVAEASNGVGSEYGRINIREFFVALITLHSLLITKADKKFLEAHAKLELGQDLLYASSYEERWASFLRLHRYFCLLVELMQRKRYLPEEEVFDII